MPSTLTPDRSPAIGQDGRPAAIGQDGQDTPLAPEPAGPPGLPASSGPRLITVPAGWPPYDCETHGAACPAAGVVAAVATAPGMAAAGVVAAGMVAAANSRADGDQAADCAALADAGPASAGEASAGEASAGEASAGEASAGEASAGGALAGRANAWPRQFAQVLVEILAGARPSRQVIPWTTEPVRAQIDHLTHELGPDRRPRIQRVVTSRPTARVVEMTVVVSFGTRSKALAMRLEHVPARHPAPGRPARPPRWLCTQIEAG